MIEVTRTVALRDIQIRNPDTAPVTVRIGVKKDGYQYYRLMPGETLVLPKGTRYQVEMA